MKRSTTAIIMSICGLSVFTLARLALYLSYDYFHSLSMKDLTTVFIQGVRFDSSVLFIVLGPILLMIMLPVSFVWWKRFWLWLAFIFYIIFALFLGGDIIYFGHVNRHVSSEIYQLGHEGEFAIEMVKQNSFKLILLCIFVVFAGYFWNKFTKISIEKEKLLSIKVVVLILLCIILIRGSLSIKPINTIDAFNYGGNIQGNLILNGIMTAYRYGAKSGVELPDYMPIEDAFKLMGLNIDDEYPLRVSYAGGAKRNIIVLIMESWSSYFIGAYGSNFNVTPNFDRLAKDGLLFKKHYATQKRSIDGIQAVLTGIPRLRGMPSLGFGLEVRLRGNLGEIADQNDFNTIFMQTSPRRSFYMDSVAGSLGFKKYFGMEDYEPVLDYPDPKASVFGWDYEGLDKFLSIVDKSSNNFIGVFFSGTTHTPFAKVPSAYSLFNGTTSDLNGFLNTLYYSDAALGHFIEEASKRDWFSDTIFIITADHTLGKFEKYIFPDDYHIPLLVYAPGIIDSGERDYTTSHLNLFPTIVTLAGIEAEVSSAGQNIFADNFEGFAYIHMGDTVAVVTDEGYVHMAGDVILESQGNEKKLSALLMAYQQVINKLFHENRW